MKFAVAALLAGVTVAKHDDAANALKITVNKWGQKKIEKEAKDVVKVAHKIEKAPATVTLKKALHKWAHTKAAYKVRALDKKFLASPAGKKLIKEWKDVGRVLKNNIHKTKNGVHFNNGAVKRLSNELDDVSDHYDHLGQTHWAPKYKAAYKKLFTNQAFQKVKWAAGNFKKAPAGKLLKKEVMELGKAVKTHVKVTDVPPKWKKAMHGLKVEIDKKGQKQIKNEAEDVAEWWEHTKDRKVTLGLGKKLMNWGESTEVNELKALDAKFKASPEGKKLMAEWKEFGEHLKAAIKPTKNGIHIDNAELDIAEENAEDIEDQYKHLEHTHWAQDFDGAFHDVTTNKEAKALHKYVETKWKPSREAKRGKKEIMELGKAIHDNVEVSDIPDHWQEEIDEMPHYMLL